MQVRLSSPILCNSYPLSLKRVHMTTIDFFQTFLSFFTVVEGEMDKLAMEEAGFRNCTEAVNLDTSYLGLQVLLGDMPHAWNFHLQLLFKEDQDEKDSYVFS
ncbi:twinkle -like protein, chloroplastic/mitochondrial [Tanacetum coccineum]